MELNEWMFRTLSKEEEVRYRKWARDNFQPGKEPNPCWHPIVRDEWKKIAKNTLNVTSR